jgi:hypothetical protein
VARRKNPVVPEGDTPADYLEYYFDVAEPEELEDQMIAIEEGRSRRSGRHVLEEIAGVSRYNVRTMSKGDGFLFHWISDPFSQYPGESPAVIYDERRNKFYLMSLDDYYKLAPIR